MTEEEKQLDRAKAFLILKDSEAGSHVLKDLEEEIEAIITLAIKNYKSASHLELINYLARLEAIKTILDEFKNAKEKVEILTKELKK